MATRNVAEQGERKEKPVKKLELPRVRKIEADFLQHLGGKQGQRNRSQKG